MSQDKASMISPTDTRKRLSDDELAKIVARNSLEKNYRASLNQRLYGADADVEALLSHIAALTAPPSQGEVERAREIAVDVVTKHMIRGEAAGPAYVVKLCIAAITQALTEPSGQMDPEAAAILCTLGCVPDSTDLSETDAKVSVGFLRRLIGSYGQGTDEVMEHALKDVIVGALLEYSGTGQGVDDMLFDVASDQADKIIAAMKMFGHLPLPVGRGAVQIPKTVTAYEAMARLMEREGRLTAAAIWQSNADALKSKQPSDTGAGK